MGTAISSPFSYWRSEATKPSSDNTESRENQPTCDPKNLNGHSDDSGDENAQYQDGGNLEGNNLDEDIKDEESDNTLLSPENDNAKGNHDQEHCISSVNGGENGVETGKESEERLKNGQNGDGAHDESDNETLEGGANDSSNPIILLNDIALVQEQSSDARNDFSSEFEAAKSAYAARSNVPKVIIGTHQRQSQLTMESRKREHSADSDRSTPSYKQHNMTYLNDLSLANRSKRQKSSETDSVSSRSDSVPAEIEQITPKVAKSRKRRTKATKKYLS